jgi:gliding motility-associated-like protein
MTNGSAQINLSGGTNPFSYSWSNGQTTLDLTNVIGGNYTLIVSDANSCKDTINVTIGIVGGPIPTAVSTDAICDQNNGTANATATGGSGVYTYQWSNGQSGSSISNLAPGSYSVTVDDGNCFSTSQVTIGNIPGPTAGFTYSPSIVTLEEPVFSFFDNSQGAISWEWNFGDGSSSVTQNSQHMYTSAGSYTVTQIVTNVDGCKDSTTSIVIVKEIVAIWVPNAFTPNQNGINEFFTPKGIGLDPNNFELYVYNRWGELIFYSSNLSYQWDGTYKGNEVPQDVYVWVIYYKGLDDIRYKKSGHVSVLK